MHLLCPAEHDALPSRESVAGGAAGAPARAVSTHTHSDADAKPDTAAALDTARTHRLRLVGELHEPRPLLDDRTARRSDVPYPPSSRPVALPPLRPPARPLAISPANANIRRLSAGRIPPALIHSPPPVAPDPAGLADPASATDVGPAMGVPIRDAADPRWVLAVRTAESLVGVVLTPEKRERLVHLGKILGLSPFDANLVIAIVQDQARRGFAPAYCPTAGEPQLRLVPLPHRELSEADARGRRILIISLIIAVAIGIELIVLKWIFS